MENTEVVNEVAVEEATSTKRGLGKGGIIALGVAGAVVTVKLAKKAWNKWLKPAIEKRKAAKESEAEVVEEAEA